MTASGHGYALITGASSGIGEALAEALAARGHALLLTARNQERLARVADRLRRLVPVEVVPANLATDAGLEDFLRVIVHRGWRVDLLINNAGLGSGGDFAELAPEQEREIVAVNVMAVMRLTHFFLPRMRSDGGGAIVLISSAAAFQPIPFMATYAASKAFELQFALALWQENRDRGVHVMAVCPGTTDTRFFERAKLRRRQRNMMSAAEVARITLSALDRRRPFVICGAPYKTLIALERLLPRPWVIAMAARFVGRREP